jgi:adenine/guanine/hypoxanthine permease
MDKFFKLKEHGTDLRTEVSAGITTFITMAYIILVNPQILSATGMNSGAVFTATIISAVIATLIMALLANVPYALAPGMGMNAFFTYTVCLGLGFSWQQALAIVLISGLVNIVITVTRVRKMIIIAIPHSLQNAISGGIGLFIAFIGFKNAHLLNFTSEAYNVIEKFKDGGVVAKDVVPAIVNFKDHASVLALIGIVIIVVLMLLRVRGAILIGIIAATIIGIPMGVTPMPSGSWLPPSIAPTFFKLDLPGLFSDPGRILTVLATILAFVLSDIFDCLGTFLGTGRKTGIFSEKELTENTKGGLFSTKLDRALFADLSATTVGAFLGTSNTTTYVESAAGIGAGGRTGLTSLVVAVLFLASLFVSPIALMVPAAATAPALIVVGILMMASIAKINWEDFEEAAPAFFTVVAMPFTFSIANGVAAGFIFYVIAKLVKGKAKEVHPIMYIVTALFLLNFVIGAIK